MATQQSDVEIMTRDQVNHQLGDSKPTEERKSLLRRTEQHSWRHHVNGICNNYRRRWCLSSKAVILILIWNIFIVVALSTYFDPSLYALTFGSFFVTQFNFDSILLTITVYSISAIIFLLYPLAGCLADIRWGRYTTILNSLCLIF